LEIFPIGMATDDLLKKPKFKGMFDAAVIGFAHSACLAKNVYDIIKKGGLLLAEKSTYLVPKKKEERKELDTKMKELVLNQKHTLIEDGVNYQTFLIN
jgi:hypothetical protein